MLYRLKTASLDELLSTGVNSGSCVVQHCLWGIGVGGDGTQVLGCPFEVLRLLCQGLSEALFDALHIFHDRYIAHNMVTQLVVIQHRNKGDFGTTARWRYPHRPELSVSRFLKWGRGVSYCYPTVFKHAGPRKSSGLINFIDTPRRRELRERGCVLQRDSIQFTRGPGWLNKW